MERRISLARHGKHLWTRELARKILAEVEQALNEIDPGDTVIIDAKGVEVFDFSFANELFGKTLLRLPSEHQGRFVVVENLTSYTRENLENALNTLGLTMIERNKKRARLIGRVHPADVETFDAVRNAKKPITALALAERLEVGLTAMNERLSKLTEKALIRREKGVSDVGREQYIYRSVP